MLHGRKGGCRGAESPGPCRAPISSSGCVPLRPGTALGWSDAATIALAVALAVAFVLTVPVNRWLIGRGKGHAVVHRYHHPSSEHAQRSPH